VGDSELNGERGQCSSRTDIPSANHKIRGESIHQILGRDCVREGLGMPRHEGGGGSPRGGGPLKRMAGSRAHR